jgi:hypothetical protein
MEVRDPIPNFFSLAERDFFHLQSAVSISRDLNGGKVSLLGHNTLVKIYLLKER